jgi:hypothetical protein
MVLTYKSSTPETRVVIEREPNGRQRVARATKDQSAARQWNLRVEHPNGRNWDGTFSGPSAEVTLALAQMLAQTEYEWVQDRERGDRPPSQAADRNVRVHDDGRFAEPTIIPRR